MMSHTYCQYPRETVGRSQRSYASNDYHVIALYQRHLRDYGKGGIAANQKTNILGSINVCMHSMADYRAHI
jgi:hypothetical protein